MWKMKSKKENNICVKSKNKAPIRVLYKQIGKEPEIKIINNVFLLKQAIINRELEILPYQNVFIIFNNPQYTKTMPINVIFDMCNIKGELLVVQINRKKREFESLTLENVNWFIQDLSRKSPVTANSKASTEQLTNKITDKKITDQYFSEIRKINNKVNNNFENILITLLTNINLTLCTLMAKKKVNK